MGAVPRTLMVTLVADPDTRVEWVRDFARSLGRQAAALDVSVAGGDLSSAPPGVLVLSITALGDLEGRPPVLRSGARAGDTIAVGGTLGRSAAGLLLLESNPALTSPAAVQRLIDSQPDGIRAGCVAHHLRPTTPVALGLAAAGAGATAMMDISDGLLRDGARLAAASGVRLDLDGDALEGDIEVLSPLVGRPSARECVLAGGEEHSLLATFPKSPPGSWRPIGTVVPGAGVAVDGQDEVPRGWDHFAG
jgi:thiamine-monophosphate kinase